MKINSINKNNVINAYNKQKQNIKPESSNKAVKDKVVISESAKYLNKINSENDSIDLDKINEIKNKIKSGTYTVNSKDVAKKIIEAIKGE